MAKNAPRDFQKNPRREDFYEQRERDARADLAGLHHAGALFGLTDMKMIKVRQDERLKKHDPSESQVFGSKLRMFAPLIMLVVVWGAYFAVKAFIDG